MCPNCRAFITTDDRVCPYCDVRQEPKRVDRGPSSGGTMLGGLIPQAHFTTVIILTINVGLYLAMMIYSGGGLGSIDGRTLIQFGAKLREAIAAGQWWRLVTAGFLHLNLLHIIMNMWVLLDLGAQVEEFFGTARYIVFYFAATVCGFYASAVIMPGLSAGASAGLFGLIGAMIGLGFKDRYGIGGMMRGMYIRWAIYVTIIGIFLGADHAAHIGGGLAGFILAYISGTPNAFGGWKEKAWRVAAGMCVALTVLAFLQMFLWFTSGPRF
jgi:rhomboid protease GluP